MWDNGWSDEMLALMVENRVGRSGWRLGSMSKLWKIFGSEIERVGNMVERGDVMMVDWFGVSFINFAYKICGWRFDCGKLRLGWGEGVGVVVVVVVVVVVESKRFEKSPF